ALRMEARRTGLAIQLAPQEWPHWLHPEPPSPCAQYHRPRRGSQPVCWSYWQKSQGAWVNHWQEIREDRPLLDRFETLPGNALTVEAD
ncbi:hypothetical protein ACPCYX_31725, partial [Pseudomonas fluorescens]